MLDNKRVVYALATGCAYITSTVLLQNANSSAMALQNSEYKMSLENARNLELLIRNLVSELQADLSSMKTMLQGVALKSNIDALRSELRLCQAELKSSIAATEQFSSVGFGSLIEDMRELDSDISSLKRDSQSLGDGVKRLGCSVRTMKPFYAPYGRPRIYFSSTELHSVSKPVRKRQGYMG